MLPVERWSGGEEIAGDVTADTAKMRERRVKWIEVSCRMEEAVRRD
jgi:hypothetical protein